MTESTEMQFLSYAELRQQSPNRGGELDDPKYIVLHYTAGSSLDSSVAWLCNPASKASAHVVIGRDGKIVQLVPFDRVAWANGASEWNGLHGLNKYAISIELDNAGPLMDGKSVATGHAVAPEDTYFGKHKNGGAFTAWQSYTAEQIEACKRVCHDLKLNFPSIKDVLGHDDIAPTRKQDAGPAAEVFKAEIRKELFGI